MKRSFLALALLACASLAVACYDAVAGPVIAAYRAVKGFALDAFKLAGAEGWDGFAKLDTPRVQAKAFVQRLEKRERHVVTNSWRMCPSI
ncbi:hypothetical protein [Rhodoferax ferrireducens]|uniref:hypothetical protein n=1 Tax=Rhodoferax ferrireducens TaxID=192843 RepID=UPI000E0CC0BE|nr:hypothetical protein [Rhodoferax ferrireducens]